jgi:hypothetical protein
MIRHLFICMKITTICCHFWQQISTILETYWKTPQILSKTTLQLVELEKYIPNLSPIQFEIKLNISNNLSPKHISIKLKINVYYI